MAPPEFLDIDPRVLHFPTCRLSGGHPVKLHNQMIKFGARAMRTRAMMILISLAYGADLRADEPTVLNEKVVEFARSKLGQRVGDGECSALAAEALRYAGAAPRGQASRWGEELPSAREARPGDVLQFEDAVFVRRRMRPDGALVTLESRYPHHTAIVSGVRRRGKSVVFSILHQNAGIAGGDDEDLKVVQEWTLNLADMKSGTLTAYRPVAK